ncbi:MAG: hypothetical protein JSS98_09570 [Bacteroidetes bacterium]|nr:hypothetical protein [Bacteroidota bacterium]
MYYYLNKYKKLIRYSLVLAALVLAFILPGTNVANIFLGMATGIILISLGESIGDIRKNNF